jgi:hypothetical protein
MRILLVCTASLLAGCMLPAPPPAASPPEIAVGTTNALPTAALLDPCVGDYRNGAALVRVRRSASGLLVDAPAGTVALTLIGLNTFVDRQGTSYLFVMVRGAPATRLAIIGANGTRREWVR